MAGDRRPARLLAVGDWGEAAPPEAKVLAAVEAARAFGAYQVESNVAQQGFDNVVRTEYAKLWGDCRAAVPDVVWLHAMLTESDRNCDAALRVDGSHLKALAHAAHAHLQRWSPCGYWDLWVARSFKRKRCLGEGRTELVC